MADNYSQIHTFILYSAAVGFVLGVVYDVFRIIRLAFNTAGKRIVTYTVYFICDLLFFTVAAIVSAIFIFHVNNGHIRGIALMGSLAGFALYYNTAGRLVALMSGAVIRAVFCIFRFVRMSVLLPLWRLVTGVSDIIYTHRQTKRRIKAFNKDKSF